MSLALVAQLAGYAVQFGPAAFEALTAGVKLITKDGTHVPTDDELAAFVTKMKANHSQLPRPE